jgi:hypothetical protein
VRGSRRRAAEEPLSEAAKQRLAQAEAWPISATDDDPIVKRMEQFIWAAEQGEAAGLDWGTISDAIEPHLPAEATAVERLSEVLLGHPLGRALTNFMTACLVEKCDVPSALKRLVWRQLDAEDTAARRIGRPGAFDRAARYASHFPKAGLREIARYAGTNPDTVARWKRDDWRKIYRTKRQS